MPEDAGNVISRQEWDDKNAPEVWRLPSKWDPRKYQHVYRLLDCHLPRGGGRRLLEVGASPGRALVFFAEEFGYEVAGIDWSEPGYQLTLENMKLTGTQAEILCGDFFTYPLEEASFDVVFSMGFIEHFEDRGRVLRRMDELLKPGGVLVATWPSFLGVRGWMVRRFLPQVERRHFVFSAGEMANTLARMRYHVLFAGPLDGPGLIDPWEENHWVRRHTRLRRLLGLPFKIFDKAGLGLNRMLGWTLESDWLSRKQGVFARKGFEYRSKEHPRPEAKPLKSTATRNGLK